VKAIDLECFRLLVFYPRTPYDRFNTRKQFHATDGFL